MREVLRFWSIGNFGLPDSCEHSLSCTSRYYCYCINRMIKADFFAYLRLIVIPLSFLRRLDSLKYTSVVALISIGYLVILVVAHFVSGDTTEDRGPLRIVRPESAIATLSSFPVIVFAYTCHQNVREMEIYSFVTCIFTDFCLDRCFQSLMRSVTTRIFERPQ